jgi:hypothetical protein
MVSPPSLVPYLGVIAVNFDVLVEENVTAFVMLTAVYPSK